MIWKKPNVTKYLQKHSTLLIAFFEKCGILISVNTITLRRFDNYVQMVPQGRRAEG